jgi:hypothetical protein
MQAKVSPEVSVNEVAKSNGCFKDHATTLDFTNQQSTNPGSLQRTVSNLHKIANVSSQQKLLRSIQRQHGNQYTARVVQRYRAEQVARKGPDEETTGETTAANNNSSYASKLLIKYLQTNYPDLYNMATTLFGPAMSVVTFIVDQIGIPLEVLIERSNKSVPNSTTSQPANGGGADNTNTQNPEVKPGGSSVPVDPTNASIREALDKITLTETKRVTERFIKPEVLHLVPHKPKKRENEKTGKEENLNPRYLVWGPLVDLLREYNAARRKPDFTPEREKAYQVKIEEAEKAAEKRLLKRGNKQTTIDGRKIIGYESASESEQTRLTAEFEVVDYKVEIGDKVVQLNSVAAAYTVERPGGFTAEVFNEAGDQQFAKLDPEAITKALEIVFKRREGATEAENATTDTKEAIARSYAKVVLKGEGGPTSLNTYDRLAITLGSGIGAAGVLQGLFDEFKKTDPEGFHEVFGQYGIDIKSGKGRGNDKFKVTNPETGETLTDGKDGDKRLYNNAERLPAREYIANNPKLLAALVTAGFNPDWQAQLNMGTFKSVERACNFNLRVDETTSFNVFNLLNGHVTENQLKVAIFTIADKCHGAGSVGEDVINFWKGKYLELAKEHGFDSTQPNSMPDAARKQFAVFLIENNNRKKHIPKALGIKNYAQLYD